MFFDFRSRRKRTERKKERLFSDNDSFFWIVVNVSFFHMIFFLQPNVNRLLCLSNDIATQVLAFYINEIYFMCNVIVSWQISSVIASIRKLILSLLTHINAYPCTICPPMNNNLFCKQIIEKRCTWCSQMISILWQCACLDLAKNCNFV